MNALGPIARFLPAAALALATLPAPARAQAPEPPPEAQPDEPRREGATPADEPDSPRDDTMGGGTPERDLPPSRSSDEPRPPAPAISRPQTTVVKQAGIGGPVAYGRSGVLELGGSLAFTAADDFTSFSLSPSIGWFFADNLELSAILRISHVATGGQDANFFSALAEPSLHVPLNDMLFLFGGLGAGISWVEGPGVGFALAPRLGVNLMIGRSGVLTPQFLIQYATHDAVTTTEGDVLAASVTYGVGVGYTVMW